MTLGEPDGLRTQTSGPVGRFGIPILEVDGVIPAFGTGIATGPAWGPNVNAPSPTGEPSRLIPYTLQTDDPNIFAGGDAVNGPRSVIEAAANGKKAAQSIDRLINGLPLEPDPDDLFDDLFKTIRVYDPQEEVRVPEKQERIPLTKLTPEERNRNFMEVEQGYSPVEAVAEAERCLRCYRVVTLSV